jgi:hypothetical protein
MEINIQELKILLSACKQADANIDNVVRHISFKKHSVVNHRKQVIKKAMIEFIDFFKNNIDSIDFQDKNDMEIVEFFLKDYNPL